MLAGYVPQHEIWNPWRKSDINKLEKVQRRATKLVSGLYNLSYQNRLRRLKIPSLAHRRLRGDVIAMYKLTHGFMVSSIAIPYATNQNLRGHSLKLEPERFQTKERSHFLCNRIVKEWNKLPNSVVTANSLDLFKSRLDNHWANTKDIYSL